MFIAWIDENISPTPEHRYPSGHPAPPETPAAPEGAQVMRQFPPRDQMPAGRPFRDRVHGHPAHRGQHGVDPPRTARRPAPGPRSTTPPTSPGAAGSACASHVMNSPTCSTPDCQVRPDRAHHRRNSAIEYA